MTHSVTHGPAQLRSTPLMSQSSPGNSSGLGEEKNTEHLVKDTLTCQRMCVAASWWIRDSRSAPWDLKAQRYEQNIKHFNQYSTCPPTGGMACVLISILLLLQWTHQHNCWDWRTQRCPYNGVTVFGTKNSPEPWQDVMQYSQIKSTSSRTFSFWRQNPKLQLTNAQKTMILHFWYASMDGCLRQNMFQLFIFVLIHRGVWFFDWTLQETDYKNIIYTNIWLCLLAHFNLFFFSFSVKVPTLKATWWNQLLLNNYYYPWELHPKENLVVFSNLNQFFYKTTFEIDFLLHTIEQTFGDDWSKLGWMWGEGQL